MSNYINISSFLLIGSVLCDLQLIESFKTVWGREIQHSALSLECVIVNISKINEEDIFPL